MARFSGKPRKSRFSRFRRRGNRGAWFPTLGTEWDVDEQLYHDNSFSGDTAEVADNRGAGPTQNVFPLTRDITQFTDLDSTITGPSLRDIVEGNTWRLNRLVGQIHVDCTEANTTVQNSTWAFTQIAAGIFVAPSANTDETLPDLTFDDVDPLNVRNIQNSWIWRRTWILSRPLASNVGFSAVPCSNSNMAAESGMFIDSRVKRRILRNHRLWFVIAAIGWQGGISQTFPQGGAFQPFVRYNLDIRIHAQMIRARNSGTF